MTANTRIRALCCLLLVTLGFVVVQALPASAAVPTKMNYQGFLTDNTNAPATGTFQMKFALYPDSTTGSVLWSETYAAVSVTSGVFNVVLGTVSPLPPAVFSGATLWLQTSVNGADILPRRAVVSVAYALRAGSVDPSLGTITGQVSSNCANVNGMLIYIPGRSFIVYAAANGTFTLDNVPPGTYTVRFNNGSFDATNVTVTAGQTTNMGIVSFGNTQIDPNNCGSCGNVCNSTNGTPSCVAGTCQISCNSGFANCDGLNTNGCEKSITSDPQNCGGCNTVCSFANAGASCVNSSCAIGSCNAGFANCDNLPGNGCEIAINSDLNNCGSCGHVCSSTNGTRSCSSGNCQIACNAGYANCNNNVADGCEIHTSNDVNNCGSCGHVCPLGTDCIGGNCQ